MAHGKRRGALAAVGLLAGYVLGCRVSPRFARAALDGLSLPVMRALHRLTSRVPFPVVKPRALALAAIHLSMLLNGVIRAAALRSPEPMRRPLARLARTALALAGALALLWTPARAIPCEQVPPVPTTDQLEWLCGELIDALNRSDLRTLPPEAVLASAPEVAGMPDCAVKAARWPEWMRAAGISGLFVPLTGEALIDAGAPGPLIPFTAVHELAHLSGVADEGAANIATWEKCLSAGGAFADSARLWALRYTTGLLRRADAAARHRVGAKMEGALARAFRMCGGEATPSAAHSPGFHMLSLNCGDYAALAGYLAQFGEG